MIGRLSVFVTLALLGAATLSWAQQQELPVTEIAPGVFAYAGQTALMMASMFGQMAVVKLLLANGANPELQDQAGNTATSLAQQQANPQMVALLTQAAKGQ